MPRGPKPLAITPTAAERAKLTDRANRPTSAQRLATRGRIVSRAADGRPNAATAEHLHVTLPTARKWRERFGDRRVDGRTDDPRPGAPRAITDAQVEAAVTRTLGSVPAGATRWSTRSRVRDRGLSLTAVGRIRRAFGLKPHLHRTSELSTDPLFAGKVRDVVGRYLAPPERAIVRCVDEKSQVRAPDRTQPAQPLLPGRPAKGTREYTRPGPARPFAAPEVAAGEVIGTSGRRHRRQGFVAALDHRDAAVAREEGTAIPGVMDNPGTRPHPAVRAWFVRRPALVPHVTPTRGSWRSQVGRFFAQSTEGRIRRGSFRSVGELGVAVEEDLRTHNQHPEPFVWTKPADPILRKVQTIAERLAPPENRNRTSDSGH